MHRRTTFVLVAIFLLLGAYVLFTQQDPAGRAGETGAQIFDVAEQDIIAVEVRSQQARASFQRKSEADGDWEMMLPERFPVDQVVVNGNAARLGRLRATRVLTGVRDLDLFGLETPRLTATLTLVDRQPLTLLIGAVNPTGTASFTRRADDPSTVYLVEQFAIDDLERLVSQPPVTPITKTPARPH